MADEKAELASMSKSFRAFVDGAYPGLHAAPAVRSCHLQTSVARKTGPPDVWSGMRNMTAAGVPDAVQHKLLGANASRWYGIEPQIFVTDEAPPIDRPDWFPQGPELEAWADKVAHPRENMDELIAMGIHAESFSELRTAGSGGSY